MRRGEVFRTSSGDHAGRRRRGTAALQLRLLLPAEEASAAGAYRLPRRQSFAHGLPPTADQLAPDRGFLDSDVDNFSIGDPEPFSRHASQMCLSPVIFPAAG